MGGGSGGGGGTTSRPLTASERTELGQAGKAFVDPYTPWNLGLDWTYKPQEYTSPGGVVDPGTSPRGQQFTSPGLVAKSTIRDPGEAQASAIADSGDARLSQVYDAGGAERLAGADYDALQQSIFNSRMAPLSNAYNQELQRVDADMAKRGIWSSGAATRGQMDVADKFTPLMQQAANDSLAQRYALESADLNSANQYNINRIANLNSSLGNQDAMLNQYNLARSNQYNTAAGNQDTMLNRYALDRSGQLNSADQAQNAMVNQFNLDRAGMQNNYNRALDADWNNFALQRAQLVNSANTANAGMANQFAVNNEQNRIQSVYRPAELMSGIWNGTSGAISSGSSSNGWNFMI